MFDLSTNNVICRYRSKPCSFSKDKDEAKFKGDFLVTFLSFSIYGMTKHPQIDELVILYGASGHSRLIDIIKGTCVWQSKESGLYRKIVE